MEQQYGVLDSEAINKTYNPNAFSADKGIRFANNIIDTIVFYILDSIYLYLLVGDAGDWITILLVPLLILFLYYFVLEATTGKTIGKLITRTKVVDQNGNRPDATHIITRSLVRFIPFEAFSFFGDEPRGWHDTVSKTWVVKDRKN